MDRCVKGGCEGRGSKGKGGQEGCEGRGVKGGTVRGEV